MSDARAPQASSATLRMLFSIGVVYLMATLVLVVRAKVLSVLLGPAAYGVISTIEQTVMSVVQLGALSMTFTAMKFMSVAHSEGQESFERAFVAFLRALVGLSLTAVIIVSVTIFTRPSVLGDLTPYRSLFSIAILGVPAAMLQIHFTNTLAAAQRGASSARLNLAVSMALAAASILGYLWLGMPGLLGAVVATGLIAGLATLRYLHRTLGLHVLRRSASMLNELRRSPQIVSVSLMIYAAMSAYSLTMLATRYHVFGQMGSVSAGLLQAQLSIALSIGGLITPLNGLFFTPLVNRRISIEDKIGAANNFAATVTAALLVGGLIVALFPGIVMTVLFSPKFSAAAPSLFWFIIWQCLYQLMNIFLQLLIGLDDVPYVSVTTCVAYGVSALLFAPLISRFGLSGAALALSAAMVVSMFAFAIRLHGKFGVGVATPVWLRSALLLLMLAGAGSLFQPSTELGPRGMALRLIYGLVAVAFFWLTLQPAEREMFIGLVRRRSPPVAQP